MSLLRAAKHKTQKQVSIDALTKVDDQPEELKRLNVNLPAKKLYEFKSVTAREGLKMSEVIEKFIDEYLSKSSYK